jgi:hypothetical protein
LKGGVRAKAVMTNAGNANRAKLLPFIDIEYSTLFRDKQEKFSFSLQCAFSGAKSYGLPEVSRFRSI